MNRNGGKRFACVAIVLCLIFAFASCGKSGGGGTEFPEPVNPDTRQLGDTDYTVMNLCGTDDYSRSFGAVKERKGNAYVGMFFFVHLGFHGNHKGIYDISTMAADNYDAFFNASVNSALSPVGMAHYFAKPIWGYYDSDDTWVMRRQIEMLTMAGVDFLALDTTNDELYEDTVITLLGIIKEYRTQGWNAPRVLFYINSNAAENTRKAYDTFYKNGEWSDCWFAPNGKPMIVTVTAANGGASDQGTSKAVTDSELLEFFEIKESQWPNKTQVAEGVPWIDFAYPQTIHRGKTGNWINVSVTQHSQTVRMSDMQANRGRGYDYATAQFDSANNDSEHMREGPNIEAQWQTVFDNADEIDYVLVTGWNEWVAQKNNRGTTVNPVYDMVDLFNEEYSRDIEPMEGGYGDNFYLQLVRNIRKFKYGDYDSDGYFDSKLGVINPSDFSEEQWKNALTYLDFKGECVARNFAGFPGAGVYTDDTNRNDIVKISVTRDYKNLYFRIETAAPITAANGDAGWMNLLIGTADGGEYGAMGLQYAVNRLISGNITRIMKYKSSTQFEIAGSGEIYTQGCVMQLSLPVSAFGFGSDVRFEFKVCDNVGATAQISDYYTKGDSAPIGRLTYFYGG